jgi:hypothetical protein
MWLASVPVARRVVINERESLLQKQRLRIRVGARRSVPRQNGNGAISPVGISVGGHLMLLPYGSQWHPSAAETGNHKALDPAPSVSP